MVKRFLEYSLRHRRPVKAVWLEDGVMKTGNLTVTGMDETSISYVTARKKLKPGLMLIDDILSVAYARGDDGDTLYRTQS
jgi:hypothetical protein